jgi:iron complex outermembrane recepter protein
MKSVRKSRASARNIASSIAIVIAVSAGYTAHAQQAAQQDHAPAEQKPAETGEIIVTAQKTSQSANKVSQALTVLSGAQLTSKGVVNVSALSNFTPGLEVGWASRGVSLSIRGVTTTDSSSKGQQDIVFSIDDVPVGRPQQMGLAFFDLDRVEVLRGPQGTLYGMSSTGGAINVITAKPTHDLEGTASVEIGNYNTRRLNGMINVPVTDNFALRAAVSSNYQDGFIHPVLFSNDAGLTQAGAATNTETAQGGKNNWTGRVTGKLDFAGGGSLVVTNTFGHVGGANDTNTVLYNDKVVPRFDVYYNPMVGGFGHDDNFWTINAALNFDVGAVHVAYDGAHGIWHGRDDNDISVNNPIDNEAYYWEQYQSAITTDSHELRLSNADPHARLEWLAGASYNSEYNYEHDVEWETFATDACAGALLSPTCNAPNPQIVGPTLHRSEGVFGQASYHATDKLKLTVGLRYSWDVTSRDATLAGGEPSDGSTTWLTASGVPCGPLVGACDNPAQTVADVGRNVTRALTYHVGVDYQLTPADLIYASVSSGYKGGGFNDFDPNTGKTGLYGAERVTAYEAGFKGRILPTLHFTSAVYYYDYSSYQLTGATFLSQGPTGAPTVTIYTTTAPATMYGWENELEWRATPNDTLGVSLSLEKAFFDHGPNQAMVGFLYADRVAWGGKSLDRVPGTSSTISYEHRFDLADGASVKFRANSKISSGYWLTDFQGSSGGANGGYFMAPAQYRQSAYTRTDLNLAYTTGNGKFEVDAFVKNVENKVQMQSAPTPGYSYYVQSGGRTVEVNDPRTFGARVTVKY